MDDDANGAERSAAPVFVVSDLHGHADVARRLLREHGLIDEEGHWTGGDASLWLLGDYVDRGPDGIGVVDLVMRLEREAPDAGGRVTALLGNHEALILAARRFGARLTESGLSFRGAWRVNGGRQSDLDRLTEEHVAWMGALPAMALLDDWLLLHADATFYLDYGRTVDTVNEAVRVLLAGDDADAWVDFLDASARRREFDGSEPGSDTRLTAFLDTFGAGGLIHGHTPIDYARGVAAESVTEAYVYADGRCVNVDGGLYRGGPGVVYRLPASDGD
jgi:hypothetical protein